MKVTYRNIHDLIPYVNNCRKHSDAQVLQIAESIKEFGFNNPVLIDGDNGIIAGHGRIMAAEQLGMDQVPCVELRHLSDVQRKAYILADNQIALNAGWDAELLKVELGELQDLDFNLDLLGFSGDELLELLPDIDMLTDDKDDEVPEPPVDPVTQYGDVWLLGQHRLMCGDSTMVDDVEKLMGGVLADMWLTDPPYNVNYHGGTSDAMTIKNDNMSDESFRLFLRDCFIAADAAMKSGAVFYIWHADLEGYNFRGACKDAGWQVRQCLIWNKSAMVLGRQDYHWKHEPCLYGWKSGASHLWASDRKQTTILNFDKPMRNGEHPTMKPVELFEYCLLNNTKGDDVVLDSFGGSGTTVIAAEKNGRISRVMELDPKYCDVIIKRWQDYTGKNATLEATGQTYDSLLNTNNVS
ncbi:MAG: site-specific DNA-methyltransferase [Neisseria sp.]|nr:site-specific DNA-methyltransferase [Neisseria sp.]